MWDYWWDIDVESMGFLLIELADEVDRLLLVPKSYVLRAISTGNKVIVKMNIISISKETKDKADDNGVKPGQ